MKITELKRSLLINFFLVISVLLGSKVPMWALYPEKQGYTYKERFADVYIGASVGNNASGTFGFDVPSYGIKQLYVPTEFLNAGMLSLSVGLRIYANRNTFLNNFRAEAEYLYIYQWYTPIENRTVFSSSFDTSVWPKKGQEVLKNALAINLYYDFRLFSKQFYPYIGAGIGLGDVKYIFISEKEQWNGVGEQYEGGKKIPFTQFIVGIQYDAKIIKSSMFIQYRAIMGSPADINPLNNGIHSRDSGTPPADYVSPQKKSVTYFNNGIAFGIKYYLY
ncbi:hypothetical protein ABSA28_00292 [Candidatus Hepatincolaceae symbiont of Richtersius coronifer]